MSLAPLIQLPQTEKSENLIKTEFLRDSASSFRWLSSSIFSSFVLSSRIGDISHLHYMIFPSIKTIYFL